MSGSIKEQIGWPKQLAADGLSFSNHILNPEAEDGRMLFMKVYRILGFIIYFSFYINFYIKMFVQSRRGIRTVQLGRRNKPVRTRIVEVTLIGTLLFTALIQFISIAFAEKIPVLIQNDFIRGCGILISIAGIIVLIVSMITLGDSWRGGIDYNQKTKLVTTGIYRYSRNPGFVGFDLFFIGMAILFSSLFNLVLACMLIGILHFQILEEEKFLFLAFGKEYSDYQKKTNRYFGKKEYPVKLTGKQIF